MGPGRALYNCTYIITADKVYVIREYQVEQALILYSLVLVFVSVV